MFVARLYIRGGGLPHSSAVGLARPMSVPGFPGGSQHSLGGGLPHCSAVGLARPMSVHQPFWRRLAADNGFCRMLRTLRRKIEQL